MSPNYTRVMRACVRFSRDHNVWELSLEDDPRHPPKRVEQLPGFVGTTNPDDVARVETALREWGAAPAGGEWEHQDGGSWTVPLQDGTAI